MSVLHAMRTLLPPPNYLLLPSVGVDISDTSLKYVQFQPDSHGGKNLKLAHYGDLPIDTGTLARGEVKDSAKLIAALKEVKRQTRSEYVRISLPEERAYLFETQIKKGTPFREVRGLLEFRLEENVPLSPRDAYFDYDVYALPGVPDKLGVSVTAYACSTINGYYDACSAAGVTPLSFEVEAQAIARAALPKGSTGTHLIVDCGKIRTGIGIVHNGTLMYTSTIDIGGKELSSALRRQLGEKEESELTLIKNTQGLVRGTGTSEICDALMATVSAINDELARRIEYWNNREVANEDRFIDSILLCGGSANLKGLPEYFEKTLKIDTKRADVWQNAFNSKEVVPPIDQQHSYGYATAIGLGLVNLI